jgi:hypothetical protein
MDYGACVGLVIYEQDLDAVGQQDGWRRVSVRLARIRRAELYVSDR